MGYQINTPSICCSKTDNIIHECRNILRVTMIGKFNALKWIHQNNGTAGGFMKEWISQVGMLCGAGFSSDASCLNLSGVINQQ